MEMPDQEVIINLSRMKILIEPLPTLEEALKMERGLLIRRLVRCPESERFLQPLMLLEY